MKPWLLLLLLPLAARATELPAYVASALENFSPDVPRDWAYTVTTTKGTETTVERYDPSRPASGQWSLLQRNGRTPTDEERDRYQRYRVTTNASGRTRAVFQRGDIDTASAQLVREDAARAVFVCRFREGVDDPLLQHLELRLAVGKAPAAIEHYTLHLTEPFTPVLGMKVRQLDVEVTLSAPENERPSLPRTMNSVFHGRLFLVKSLDEEVRTVYSEFTRVSSPAKP